MTVNDKFKDNSSKSSMHNMNFDMRILYSSKTVKLIHTYSEFMPAIPSQYDKNSNHFFLNTSYPKESNNLSVSAMEKNT